MGGVDHFDQRRERYAIGRRSLKWWHRLFYSLIDLAIVLLYGTAIKVVIVIRLALARQLATNRVIKKEEDQLF